MIGKIRQYFFEAREELRQVQWPMRREALYLTALVIAFSVLIGVFLGAFDFLFIYLIRLFISA